MCFIETWPCAVPPATWNNLWCKTLKTCPRALSQIQTFFQLSLFFVHKSTVVWTWQLQALEARALKWNTDHGPAVLQLQQGPLQYECFVVFPWVVEKCKGGRQNRRAPTNVWYINYCSLRAVMTIVSSFQPYFYDICHLWVMCLQVQSNVIFLPLVGRPKSMVNQDTENMFSCKLFLWLILMSKALI